MHVTNDIQASSSADIEQIHGMQTIVDAMDTISGLLSSLANSYRFVSAKDDQDSNCDHPSSSHTGAEMNRDYVPISKRLLLNFKEAAMLLSMSEASLRDLVHKGQGPENVRRGKRVCFTQEGLKKRTSTGALSDFTSAMKSECLVLVVQFSLFITDSTVSRTLKRCTEQHG